MTSNDPTSLVSSDWLFEHLADSNLRIIDASFVAVATPGMERNVRAEYEAKHIPQARFVDIDEASDAASTLPHMLPSADKFAAYMSALGIGDEHQVVVYDSAGLFSAARVWWMFKYFGHDNVAVLDGGLPKWLAENRPVTDAAPTLQSSSIAPKVRSELLRDAAQVEASAALGDYTVVDARAAPRFRGEVPEPREGLRSGHIPNSRNVPFATLLQPDGTLKNPDELRLIFEAAGLDLTKPAITTCGSGVTAAILSLALELIGVKHALYDGSWAQWGMYGDLAVATGEA